MNQGRSLDQQKIGSFCEQRATQLLREGLRLVREQKIEDAKLRFTDSHRLMPSPESLTFWGWAEAALGDLDRGIELCMKAIELDGEFGNPYNDVGTYYMRKGDLEQAIPWLEAAKKAKRYDSPHFPFINLGRVYLAQFRLPEALKEFEQALKLDPWNGEIREVVGQLRVRVAPGAAALVTSAEPA